MKLLTVFSFVAAICASSVVQAHCEIPCGIYGDKMRVELIREHLSTIEKSMKTIITLQKENPKNYNQLVRWVQNKEEHAKKIQEIVTQYFMTQRVKVPASDKDPVYSQKLALLHQLLVGSMKMKQTTDTVHIRKAHKALDAFVKLYFK